MAGLSLLRFHWPRWLIGLFIVYSLYLLWENFNARERIRDSIITEYRLQAEKRAAALTDFLAARRADLRELAESSELHGYFANRDLQMSMQYGLRFNLMAIEGRFARTIAGKQTAGTAIYDAIMLADDAGRPLASAGTLPAGGIDLGRYASPHASKQATLLETAPARVITSMPVIHKDKQVGQLIALVGVTHLGRYYAQDIHAPSGWDESLVDTAGLPVFGDAHYLDVLRQLSSVVQAMGSGAARWVETPAGQDFLLLKWSIEGTPYHLLTLVPEITFDKHMTPTAYLFVAGSVPLAMLIAALYFGHMRRVNRELADQIQESDRKRGELVGKYTALELEIQRREAVETALRQKGQELEERTRELQAAMSEASHLARYDSLTGLSNRMMYRDELQRALQHAQHEKSMLAVLFLDLDHFKRVNDSLGHTVGDGLLQEIAHRVVNCLRETDSIARGIAGEEAWCIARQGGDEFTLFLTNIDQPFAVVQVARRLIEAVTRPLRVEGHNLVMTCSIGIAVYPTDGDDADTLLKNADTAMYSAKEQGRNRYQFFEAAMQASVLRRLELDNALAHALDKGELSVHYQPIVHCADGRVAAFEALLRWRHADKGAIPPSEFIPLAEESGQIIPLTNFVLAEAARLAQSLQERDGGTARIAVNLSGRMLDLVDIPHLVAGALRAGPADINWLELELTESTLMHKREHARGILDQLRTLGVRVSIDDFGTGYSSLAYLKAFPIDTLKIDRSFVVDLPQDDDGAAIVRGIIALAHSLGLETIAEGVETVEQLDFLREAGCDQVQGYLLGRPAPAADIPSPHGFGLRL